MTLLIAQSDLSQPFIRPWMVCLNVVPEVFKNSKKTPTIFQLAWSRAPVVAKATPVCLAEDFSRFVRFLRIMIIVWCSEIMWDFHKFTKPITEIFITELFPF